MRGTSIALERAKDTIQATFYDTTAALALQEALVQSIVGNYIEASSRGDILNLSDEELTIFTNANLLRTELSSAFNVELLEIGDVIGLFPIVNFYEKFDGPEELVTRSVFISEFAADSDGIDRY